MADVLVLGGGICGALGAMMLARDGHDVTVLERDVQPPPDTVDEAVQAWSRPGVAQFGLLHYVHARFRHTIEAELPDVKEALVGAGGREYDPLEAFFPPSIADRSARAGDDRWKTVTGRRQMLEAVVARAAHNERGVDFRRGVKVRELLFGPEAVAGVPNVIGVRTSSDDEIKADIIVDAMGRSSKLPQWLSDAGFQPPHEEATDAGFTYYNRYYRGDQVPEQVGPGLAVCGSISVLTLPCDNNTWGVVVLIASGDQPLKQLRHNERWEKVVRSLPNKAHWLDGEPITDVAPMSGVLDRHRCFMRDGHAVVTGVLPLADAKECTNPSYGRGVSLGVWHAQMLRDHLRKADGDAGETAYSWDVVSQAELTPWFDLQLQMDKARAVEMEAAREGHELLPPDPDDVQAQMTKAFTTAVAYDPDCFRAFLDVQACLRLPQQVMSEPGMVEKVIAAADGREPPLQAGWCPTRQALLELVA